MSRCPIPFRKSDVARAVKAVQEAGIDIARIEIDKDGKIVIVTTTGSGIVPGDEIDREIEAFRREHHGARKT